MKAAAKEEKFVKHLAKKYDVREKAVERKMRELREGQLRVRGDGE